MWLFNSVREISRSALAGFDGFALEVEGLMPSRLDLVLDGELSRPPGAVSSLETRGAFHGSPDEFMISGELDFSLKDKSSAYEEHEFSLDNSNGRYFIEASQTYVIYPDERHSWENKSRTALTLENALSNIEPYFTDDIDVEIDSHSMIKGGSEGMDQLDIEYSVELGEPEIGMIDGVSKTLNNDSLDGSRTPEIDEVDIYFSREDEDVEATFMAALSNHHSLIIPLLQSGGLPNADMIYEAKRVSEYSSEGVWWGEYREPRLSMGLDFTSNNTERYIRELRRRDIPAPPVSDIDLEAQSYDDSLDIYLDFEGEGIPDLSPRALVKLERWYGVFPLPLVALSTFLY